MCPSIFKLNRRKHKDFNSSNQIDYKIVEKSSKLILPCLVFLLLMPWAEGLAQTAIPYSTFIHATSGSAYNDLYLTLFDETGSYFIGGGDSDISALPVTPGAYSSSPRGSNEISIVKVDANGQVVWATYMGGDRSDMIRFVQDPRQTVKLIDGALYISFRTESDITSLPGFTLYGPGGEDDMAVAKIDTSDGSLIWGTVIGGSDEDEVRAMAIAGDQVFIRGQTEGLDMPVTADAVEPLTEGAYLAILDATTGAMEFGTSYNNGATKSSSSSNTTYSAIDAMALAGNTLAVGGYSGENRVLTPDAPFKNSPVSGRSLFFAYFDISTRQFTFDTYTISDVANGDGENITDIQTDGTRFYVANFAEGEPYQTFDNPDGDNNTLDAPFFQVWNGTTLEYAIAGNVGDRGQSLQNYRPLGLLSHRRDPNSLLKVDTLNNRWFVYGQTNEDIFTPVNGLAIQSPGKNRERSFIREFEMGTNNIVFATTFEDDNEDGYIVDFHQDSNGYLYLLGQIEAPDLAGGLITPDAWSTVDFNGSGEEDVFFVILDSTRTPVYGTYLGSIDYIYPRSLNIRADGIIEIAGNNWDETTGRSAYPVTEGAHAEVNYADGFLYTQLDICPPTTANSISPDTQMVCINGRTAAITGTEVYIDTAVAQYPRININQVYSSQYKEASYQWEFSADNVNWVEVPDATERDFLPPPTGVDVYYRRRVGNAWCNNFDYSNVHTVRVNGLQAPSLSEGQTNICPATDVVIGLPATGGSGGGNYSYAWNPATDLSATNVAQPTFNGAVSATYTIVVTDTDNGCEFEEAWQVNVVSADAGTDVNYCMDTLAPTLIGTSGIIGGDFVYDWTSISGDAATSLVDSTTAQTQARPLVNTTYELEVSIVSTGCSTRDTIDVLVGSSTADAGTDTLVGLSEPVVLGEVGQAGYSYSWAPGAYLDNQNTAQPTMSVGICPDADVFQNTDNPLQYIVTKVDNASGCFDYDTILVSILDINLVSNFCNDSGAVTIGEQKSSCGLGLPGVTYQWSVVSGDPTLPGITNTSMITVDPTTVTVYQLDVCIGSLCISDQVTVDSCGCGVSVAADSDITCPVGGSFNTELYAKGDLGGIDVSALSSNYTFQWLPVTGLVSPNSIRTAVNALASDETYTFYVLDAGNGNDTICKTSSVTVYASAVSSPITGLAGSVTTCASNSVSIGVVPVAGWDYGWSPSMELSDPTISNPRALVSNTTRFYITATDQTTGCAYMDSTDVIVDEVVANAGEDKTFCANAIVTLGSTPLPGYSYNWAPAVGLSEPTAAQPLDTVFASTSYYLTVTDNASGCTALDTINLTFSSPPVYDAPDVTVCEGGSVQIGLPAQSGYSYIWFPSTNLSNDGIAQPFASPNTNTTYTVLVSDGNPGCVTSDNVTVTTLNSAYSLALNDTSACVGAMLNIGAADQGGTYAWTPTAGLSDHNISDPSMTNGDTATTYVLNWMTPDGCVLSGEVIISPVIPTLSMDTLLSICAGDTISIGPAPEAGATYNWTSLSGDPVSTLSDPAIANPVANPSQTTVYQLQYTSAEGCVLTDSVRITTLTPPTVDLGNDTTVCDNFLISPVTTGSIFRRIWKGVLGNYWDNTLTVSPTEQTTVILTVLESNTCEASDTLVLSTSTDFSGGLDKTICSGETTTIGTPDMSGGVLTYTWSINSGPGPLPGVVNTAEIQVSPTGTTEYLLTADDGMGCVRTDIVEVEVGQDPNLDLGADQVVCANGCITIGANVAGFSYQWVPDIGVSDPTKGQTLICPTVDTTYELIATHGTTGCTYSDEINISLTTDTVPVVNAGIDSVICSGNTIQLGSSPTAGLLYNWSPGTGLSNPSIADPNLTLNNTSSTPDVEEYILTAIDPNTFCQSKDTVSITIGRLPSVSITAPSVLCYGTTGVIVDASVSSSDNGPVSWTPADLFEDPTILEPTLKAVYESTVLSLTKTDTVTGCANTASVPLTVSDEAVGADAGPDHIVCLNDSVTVGTPDTSGGVFTYEWFTADYGSTNLSTWDGSFIDGDRDDAEEKVRTSQDYYSQDYIVQVTGTSGCIAEDRARVTVYEDSVNIDAGLDALLCEQDNYTLTAVAPSEGSGVWSQVSGPNTAAFNFATTAQPTISGLITGTYVFRWTVAGEICNPGFDEVTVEVVDGPSLMLADTGIVAGTTIDLTDPSIISSSTLNGAALSYWVDSSTVVSVPDAMMATVGTYYFKAFNTTTGCQATAALSVLGLNPPVAINDTTSTAEDTPVTLNALLNDYDPDGSLDGDSLRLLTVPFNGMMVDNGDSTVTYTPNADFYGIDSVQYELCDTSSLGSLCDTAWIFITVVPVNDPPVAINDTTSTAEDTPVSLNALLNDYDIDGALPGDSLRLLTTPFNGMMVDNGDSTVTYTPNVDFYGIDSVQYELCDTSSLGSLCDTAWIFITVLPVNDPPIAVNDTTSTPEDTPVTLNALLNDYDPDGSLDGDSLRLLTTPFNGMMVDNGDSTVIYTPNSNFFGIDSVQYELCDTSFLGSLCDTAWIFITVTPVNDPPVAVNDTTSTAEDTPVSLNALLNDYDIDGALPGDSLRLLTTPFNGMMVDNGDSTVTYTPNADFFGIDSVQYEICDTSSLGSLCDTAWIFITVTPVNDPPVAVNDTTSTAEDTPVTLNALLNDYDIDGALPGDSLRLLTVPFNGMMVDNGDSTVTYTPDPNFYGIDSVQYEICDTSTLGSLCDTAWIFITVTPVNDPPVAVNDSVSTMINTPVPIDILSNDDDPLDPLGNIDPTTVDTIPGQGPTNGDIIIDPVTGEVIYTPDLNFTGIDSFEYRVCDDGNPLPAQCDTAWVFIDVTAPLVCDINLAVWLEGAYSTTGDSMHTNLNVQGLLPGQDPIFFLGTPTAVGQPYSGAPWNYSGTEGDVFDYTVTGTGDAGYDAGVVDWVLVSLRTSPDSSSTTCTQAALLYNDGTVAFPGGCNCNLYPGEEYYIVIEHRNHLPVMTPTLVTVSGGSLDYDFRMQQSYTTFLGDGQKNVETGVYAMYAANGDQDNAAGSKTDVNSTDEVVCTSENSNGDVYTRGDYNLDGDVNANDESVWLKNTSKSSDVDFNN